MNYRLPSGMLRLSLKIFTQFFFCYHKGGQWRIHPPQERSNLALRSSLVELALNFCDSPGFFFAAVTKTIQNTGWPVFPGSLLLWLHILLESLVRFDNPRVTCSSFFLPPFFYARLQLCLVLLCCILSRDDPPIW